MGKVGTIKDTFPPGNNGTQPGAGRITEDGTGTNYVFQTPDDVAPGLTLSEGMKVNFEANGRQATGVKSAGPTQNPG